MSKRRRITVELTRVDERHIKRIRDVTGEPTIIGAIRYALRETVQGLPQPPISPERLIALDDLAEQAQEIGMGYE